MAPNPIKVLVAEDEPTMLALLASHLRHLGFSVIEASEGDVAWQLLEEHGPDLVILDVMMPGMSGWDICKRLKSHTVGPLSRTGVIMLTGIGETLNDATSELFGADAWLNKPFEFVDLDRTIYATLESYGKRGSSAPGSTLNGLAKPARRAAKAAVTRAAKKAKPAAKKITIATLPAKKAAPASANAKKGASAKKAAKKAPAAKRAASPKKTAAKDNGASARKAVQTKDAKGNGASARKAPSTTKKTATKSATGAKPAAKRAKVSARATKRAAPKAQRSQPAGRAKR